MYNIWFIIYDNISDHRVALVALPPNLERSIVKY